MTSNINNNRKNIAWINTSRAILIFLVYLCHSQSRFGVWLPYEQSLVQPFFVNAFFFISGYLLIKKHFQEGNEQLSGSQWFEIRGGKSLICNILYKIALPSFIITSAMYLPKQVVRGIDGINYEEMIECTIGGCTMWFTSALVVAELILFVALFIKRGNLLYLWIVGVITLIAGLCLNSIHPGAFPWFYKSGMLAILPIVAGGTYWKFENVIDKNMKEMLCVGALVCYVVAILFANDYIKYSCEYIRVSLGGFIAFCVSTLLLIHYAKKVRKIDWVDYVGRNTLILYLFSGALPESIGIIVHKFLPSLQYTGVIVVTLVSFSLGAVLTFIVDKYIPWLLDLRLLKKK